MVVTLPDSGRNQDASSSAVQGWNTAGESEREVSSPFDARSTTKEPN